VIHGSAFGATKATAQDEATPQTYNKLEVFPNFPGSTPKIEDSVIEDHSSRSDIVCFHFQLYFTQVTFHDRAKTGRF